MAVASATSRIQSRGLSIPHYSAKMKDPRRATAGAEW